MENAMVHVLREDQARINITYSGSNGELPDPVNVDTTDDDVKRMLSEVLRAGDIPGIAAQPNVDLRDFVVDRFGPTEARPYNLIMVRPKTPFGMAPGGMRREEPLPNVTQASNDRDHRCPHCLRKY